MPMFDFRCEACGHIFEELVSSSSQTPECPKCQSSKVARLLSRFSVRTGTSGGGSVPPVGGGHKHSCNSFG